MFSKNKSKLYVSDFRHHFPTLRLKKKKIVKNFSSIYVVKFSGLKVLELFVENILFIEQITKKIN